MSQWVKYFGSFFNENTEQESPPMESKTDEQKLDPPAESPTMSIIWLDEAQTSEENAVSQEELRTFCSNFEYFEDDAQCEQYIKDQPDGSQIILIVNGRLVQKIVPRVHDCPKILSIYIFSLYKKFHEERSKEFSKVMMELRGNFIDRFL